MFLESLGADAGLFSAFESFTARGMLLGRVAAANRDQYRLFTATGEMAAEPSGALYYRTAERASMPVTGDWVAARVAGPQHAIVEAVLPRRTCFSRRAAGRREKEQVLAANIDLVFVVCGLDGDFNLRRIERYLALAAASNVSVVIALNKTDQCPEVAAKVAEAQAIAGGVPVIAVSALHGNCAALTAFLAPGRTVALLGSSGAGKSTIVNRLLGVDRQATSAVRTSDSRGRHTTTTRELIPLGDYGVLIDTPGLREIQLWADSDSVESVFDEIARLAANCRYHDCSHQGEQGCAVAAALATGTLLPERFQSYSKLLAEARHHESLADALAAQERKRKWKRIHKAQREFYKSRPR